MRNRTEWLWIGVGLLLVSLFAVLMQSANHVEDGSRTAFVLEGWVERTGFWLGLVFIAGHVLDNIYGSRR